MCVYMYVLCRLWYMSVWCICVWCVWSMSLWHVCILWVCKMCVCDVCDGCMCMCEGMQALAHMEMSEDNMMWLLSPYLSAFQGQTQAITPAWQALLPCYSTSLAFLHSLNQDRTYGRKCDICLWVCFILLKMMI